MSKRQKGVHRLPVKEAQRQQRRQERERRKNREQTIQRKASLVEAYKRKREETQ